MCDLAEHAEALAEALREAEKAREKLDRCCTAPGAGRRLKGIAEAIALARKILGLVIAEEGINE
jgi:hypothetical protein